MAASTAEGGPTLAKTSQPSDRAAAAPRAIARKQEKLKRFQGMRRNVALSRQQLRQLFRHLDTDNDESISYAEFRAGLLYMGYDAAQDMQAVARLLRRVDKNQTGAVSEPEFVRHFMNWRLDDIVSELRSVSPATDAVGVAVVAVTYRTFAPLQAAGVPSEGAVSVCLVDTGHIREFLTAWWERFSGSPDVNLWLDVSGHDRAFSMALAELLGIHIELLQDAFVFQSTKVEVSRATHTEGIFKVEEQVPTPATPHSTPPQGPLPTPPLPAPPPADTVPVAPFAPPSDDGLRGHLLVHMMQLSDVPIHGYEAPSTMSTVLGGEWGSPTETANSTDTATTAPTCCQCCVPDASRGRTCGHSAALVSCGVCWWCGCAPRQCLPCLRTAANAGASDAWMLEDMALPTGAVLWGKGSLQRRTPRLDIEQASILVHSDRILATLHGQRPDFKPSHHVPRQTPGVHLSKPAASAPPAKPEGAKAGGGELPPPHPPTAGRARADTAGSSGGGGGGAKLTWQNTQRNIGQAPPMAAAPPPLPHCTPLKPYSAFRAAPASFASVADSLLARMVDGDPALDDIRCMGAKALALEVCEAVAQRNFLVRDGLLDWRNLVEAGIRKAASSAHVEHLYVLGKVCAHYTQQMAQMKLVLDPAIFEARADPPVLPDTGSVGGGAGGDAAGTAGGGANATTPGIRSSTSGVGAEALAAGAFLDPRARFFTDEEMDWRELYDDHTFIHDDIKRIHASVADMRAFYQQQSGDQMNRVLFALTLVTTVVLPAQVLSGVWGMNFQQGMWELEQPWGYGVMYWGLSIVLGVAVALLFVRRYWAML